MYISPHDYVMAAISHVAAIEAEAKTRGRRRSGRTWLAARRVGKPAASKWDGPTIRPTNTDHKNRPLLLPPARYRARENWIRRPTVWNSHLVSRGHKFYPCSTFVGHQLRAGRTDGAKMKARKNSVGSQEDAATSDARPEVLICLNGHNFSSPAHSWSLDRWHVATAQYAYFMLAILVGRQAGGA